MDRAGHAAQSMRWNLNRENELQGLVDGSTPTDEGGWRRVSRHSASMNSAYKCMATLKLQWPTLDFKVRKPVHPRSRWVAEIWARRKEQQ